MERDLAGSCKVKAVSVENARSNCPGIPIVSFKMLKEHSLKSVILTHEDPQLLQITLTRN